MASGTTRAPVIGRSVARTLTSDIEWRHIVKTFSASAVIQAAPETVWNLLTQVADWARWNPTVEKVEGEFGPGKRITIFATMSPGRGFPVTVSELVPGQRMVFTGGMPLGLFRGTRTFTLARRGDGGVDFTTSEVFSGPLAFLITRVIPDLQPSFDTFAAALKQTAEEAPAGRRNAA
jgi:hypothetical protein